MLKSGARDQMAKIGIFQRYREGWKYESCVCTADCIDLKNSTRCSCVLHVCNTCVNSTFDLVCHKLDLVYRAHRDSVGLDTSVRGYRALEPDT